VGIYVPIFLEEKDGGSVLGRFPFKASYEVSGSKKKVIKTLYKEASKYLHNSKDRQFLESLNPYREGMVSYIKLDLFSRAEHFFFSTIFLILAVLIFSFFFNILAWGILQISAGGLQPLLPELQEKFQADIMFWGPMKGLIFILVWNFFYYKIYPGMMSLYGNVLLEFSDLRELHLRVISSPCHLFSSKSSVLDEGDYHGDE
jgi:hypothetical protein